MTRNKNKSANKAAPTTESTGTMDSNSAVHKPKKTSNKPKTKTCDVKQESKKSNTVSMKRKVEVKLRPSAIRYSQSSISSVFSDGTNIGGLLDDIYFGRCFASALQQIEVSQISNEWVAADNRRLWVFKQLEILGRVDFIIAKHVKKIYSGKLTSDNAGTTIEIRNGKPAGVVYSLLYGDSQECQTNQSATKNKKRRRSRRRKAKKANTNSTNQNQCQSERELVNSDNLDRSQTDSDGFADTLTPQLDTIVQYTPCDDANSEDLSDSNCEYSDFEDRFDDLDCIFGLEIGKAVPNSIHDCLIDAFDYENELTTSKTNSHNVPEMQDDSECVSGGSCNVSAMHDDTSYVYSPSNHQYVEHTTQNYTQYEQSIINSNIADDIQTLHTLSQLNADEMLHSEWGFNESGDIFHNDTSASKYNTGHVKESQDFASSFHSSAVVSKVQTEGGKGSYGAVYTEDIVDEICDVCWCPRYTNDYLRRGHYHEPSGSSHSISAESHYKDRAMVEKTNTDIKQKQSGILTLLGRFSTGIGGFFSELFK